MDAYLPLKHFHIALVATSVGFFTLRGLALLAGAGWPRARRWRRTSAALDTLLLATGVALEMMLSLDPRVVAWFGTKLAWIVAYIVIGYVALHRAKGRVVRALAFALALGCAAMAATTALQHRPFLPWHDAAN